jgi:hypothetical protein
MELNDAKMSCLFPAYLYTDKEQQESGDEAVSSEESTPMPDMPDDGKETTGTGCPKKNHNVGPLVCWLLFLHMMRQITNMFIVPCHCLLLLLYVHLHRVEVQ